jgi:hypothetical protein
MQEAYEKSQFYCKVCVPEDHPVRSEQPQKKETHYTKLDNGFKCKKCNLVVKTKYSMERHVIRMHDDQDEVGVENSVDNEAPGDILANDDVEVDNPDEFVEIEAPRDSLADEEPPQKKKLIDVLKAVNLVQRRQRKLLKYLSVLYCRSVNIECYVTYYFFVEFPPP